MSTKLNFSIFSNVINGRLRGATKTYHGINPFTEEQLWPVPVATENDLDDAVEAGNIAFKKWRQTTVKERRRRLKDFADAALDQLDEFSDLVSNEAGMTKEFAPSEIEEACEWLNAVAQNDLPEHVSHEDEGVKVTTRYYPLGVVAAICPWNFPIFLAAGKIASAVVTGNTVIVKPSPYTPYSALKFVELAQQFFPVGVIQALGGDDNLGPWMTKHPRIAKISFTGSSATGKRVMAAAAPTLKRVTLELGGNDAAIVCQDVDMDAIMPQIVEGAFSHGGQVCIASKRLYVHASIYDVFMTKFVPACSELKAGSGFLSPIQNRMQYDKVRSVYDDCRDRQYDFALGDGDLGKATTRGYFVPPAIVARPPDKSRIVQEESFGPILPVLTWDDDEEVIQRANDTDQGLGATLWCRDPERAERIASRLEAGSVWVNRGAMPMPTALFGGVKQSGIGGEWGQLGLTNYCEARTVHIGKN